MVSLLTDTSQPKKLAFKPAPRPRMHFNFEEITSASFKTAAKAKEEKKETSGKTDVKQPEKKNGNDVVGKDVNVKAGMSSRHTSDPQLLTPPDTATEPVIKKRPNESNAQNKKSKKRKKGAKLEQNDEQKAATKDIAVDAGMSSIRRRNRLC